MRTVKPRLRRPGFTLIELLVAVLVSGILIGVTTSTYVLFRKSVAQDQGKTEISQNARIAMDRLTRDLRQTTAVVTVLPTAPSDLSVTQPHEIEFEDGHLESGDTNYLSTRRYYLSGTTLKLDINLYKLSGATVRYNVAGASKTVLSTQDIAQEVTSLMFYNDAGTMEVDIATGDGGNQSYSLQTVIRKRN
jgi:prepilin-type N-terminal cleavage/methylation domain-containing protein